MSGLNMFLKGRTRVKMPKYLNNLVTMSISLIAKTTLLKKVMILQNHTMSMLDKKPLNFNTVKKKELRMKLKSF